MPVLGGDLDAAFGGTAGEIEFIERRRQPFVVA
jgi:hypothetical protein